MGSKSFQFHPEAREEFRNAIRWYREQNLLEVRRGSADSLTSRKRRDGCGTRLPTQGPVRGLDNEQDNIGLNFRFH
jgi:hypothetical protein